MAYKRKTQPVEPIPEMEQEQTQEYVVVEAYKANINNKKMSANVGDRVQLTPTQYSVLKRFVL